MITGLTVGIFPALGLVLRVQGKKIHPLYSEGTSGVYPVPYTL